MRSAIFFVLWMTFALGAPMAVSIVLPFEYPLISLAGAVGFLGGALLAAGMVGWFRGASP